MHAKSLKRHCMLMHNTILKPRAVCVDENQGIFFVHKHQKGGIKNRTHVQKYVGPNSAAMQREESSCNEYMKVTKRSGMLTVEYSHLQDCSKFPEYVEKKVLSYDCLNNLSSSGEYKILRDETIKHCKKLQDMAEIPQSQLTVAIKDGDRFMRFSVFDGGVHYQAKLGRATVTADLKQGTLDCCCCLRKRGCVHEAVRKWYLMHKVMKY